MDWIFVGLFICLLGTVSQSKQSPASADNIATPPSLIWNNADRHTSPHPPLKLDPVLRRALLRALTQLELEAQRKAGVTTGHAQATPPDDEPTDVEQETNIKRDLEELLGNYENAYNQQLKPRTEPQPNTANDSVDMIVLDGQNPEQADVSVFDYDVPSDVKSSPNPPDDKQDRPALFFRNENGPETEEGETGPPQSNTSQQNIDIQSNIIPRSNSAKRVNEGDSSALETSPTTDKKSVVKSGPLDKSISSAVGGAVKLDLDDQEVSIFQAPLVAAFTLQQDEKGNPRSVVPLLRRQQPIVNQQQQRLQIPQQHRFQPSQPQFTREQELERKTRLLEEQLRQLQQQQQQFQQQQQQQQFHQQQLLKQQQLQQEEDRLRQQRLFEEEQQQRLRFQQQQFRPVEQPLPPPLPTPDHQRAQRQETGTAIVDFQQSQEFQFQPSRNFQQPINTNLFQPPPLPLTSNNFFQQQLAPQRPPFLEANPSSVNTQLQNLLYQSGVAENFSSPQEDLNIVSKVLSLNHEGRVNRPGRETLELTVGVQPPSRVIKPPFP